jgi:hypothetical protein
MQPRGLGEMDSMRSRSVHPPGKSGSTFDHILSQLWCCTFNHHHFWTVANLARMGKNS